MKTILGAGFLAAALVFAGCADVADRLSEPVIQAPPQVHVFAADSATVFAAARAALGTMGYRFTHGGPAEGRLEAISDIMPGDAPNSSKQVSLKVRFDLAQGGGTQVTISVEQVAVEQNPDQTDQAGAARETPGAVATTSVPDDALCDVFFRAIQQNLNAAQK